MEVNTCFHIGPVLLTDRVFKIYQKKNQQCPKHNDLRFMGNDKFCKLCGTELIINPEIVKEEINLIDYLSDMGIQYDLLNDVYIYDDGIK